jgi:hypothetical protein
VPAVLVLAGCGGGTKAISTTTVPQRTASPSEAAKCLNDDLFTVDHGRRTVSGSAPDGVLFIVRFYDSRAEAHAARRRLDPKYAVVMGSAVINYAGNPPRHRGGPPRVLIHDDFGTLRHCILPR